MNFVGFSFESNPNAVGKPDHGHARLSCLGYGIAIRGDAGSQAIWQNKASYFSDNDEEHHRPFCLPADHHLWTTLFWFDHFKIQF